MLGQCKGTRVCVWACEGFACRYGSSNTCLGLSGVGVRVSVKVSVCVCARVCATVSVRLVVCLRLVRGFCASVSAWVSARVLRWG